METAEDFRSVSERVATEFVQTVVVVDDRAFSRTPDVPVAPTRLKNNPFRRSVGSESEAVDDDAFARTAATSEPVQSVEAPVQPGVRATEEATESGKEQGRRDVRENLDASALIQAFATAGIVCAVMEPTSKNDSLAVSAAARAAERADIVVLDWFIHEAETGGETTKEVIRRILDHDDIAGGRLRLIAIYTGEPIPPKITESIDELLRSRGKLVTKDRFTLQSGALRIAVLMKANQSGKTYDAELESLQVDEAGLPKVLLREFAQLTSGLVSNAAVRSLAVLRANTHALLANLDRRIDAAFLTHRACQGEPDESVRHLEDLLTGEIGAMLSGFETGAVAGGDSVAGWIQARDSFEHPDTKKSVTKENLIRLVQTGDMKAVDGIASKNNALKNLTKLLQAAEHSQYDSDAAYAVATSMVRRYGLQPEPTLVAGVVVRRVETRKSSATELLAGEGETSGPSDEQITPNVLGEYLICLQPVCDSVRIEQEGRPFLFLPAEIVADGDNKFELVLEDGPEAFVRLKHKAKMFRVLPINFKAAPDEKVVRATRTRVHTTDFSVFTDAHGCAYAWVGQMKAAHAQRLLQKVANDLSRVGLNESEWLSRAAEAAAKA